MTATDDAPTIDLIDPGSYASGAPIEQLLWLQEHDPVHWHPEPGDEPGFWVLTRYADIKALESDHALFSSSPVTQLTGVAVGDDQHRILIFEDPPGHTEHRKFVGEELLPIRVRDMREHLESLVDDIIDEVIERGECDFANDVAGKLASYVTADMMGIPREQAVELYETSEAINNAANLEIGPGAEAMARMGESAGGIFADRVATPRDDMASRLANGQLYGRPVDAFNFTLDFLLILNAGGDTSRNVVAGGMEALFANPEQRQLLMDDPALVPSAVEEMLRWVTPIVYQRRTATRDTRIGDRDIKAGDKVVGFYAAANRDPRQFDDPDVFDVRRTPNAHLAFGTGTHFCLGSHLARLELIIMFKALLKRMPDLAPSGPTLWVRTGSPNTPSVVGPKSMMVTFTPGRRVNG